MRHKLRAQKEREQTLRSDLLSAVVKIRNHVCIVCGRDFKAKAYNAVRCPKCQREHRRKTKALFTNKYYYKVIKPNKPAALRPRGRPKKILSAQTQEVSSTPVNAI